MSVSVSPAGLSTTSLTANQLSATVSYRERLCKSVCSCMAAASNLPITIQYTHGTPILSGTAVFVPITATIIIPWYNNCGVNNQQRIVEQFDVSFQGQTAEPADVEINSAGRVVRAQGNCALINDSITVELVAAES